MANGECNCRVCNNDDLPAEAPRHDDDCTCYECHEAGYHEDTEQWASDCEWCDEILVQNAIDEAKEAAKKEAGHDTNIREEGETEMEGC